MKLKRLISMALATVATTISVATLSACETARPEVKITIEFQEETYTLDYVLYRKIAPATVAHFITLAENHYYDGLVVHDYNDGRLYTGGYNYEQGAANGGLIYKEYYEFVKTHKVPTTVLDIDGTSTYTLYGEFAANNFEVEHGHLKEEYGTLGMFYTQKDAGVSVDLDHPEAGPSNNRDYKYNSATSLFFISLSTTTRDNSAYCTFAKLDEDSLDELKALDAAVAKYISDHEDATEKYSIVIDTDDRYFGEHQNRATYQVLSSPIIVKTVSVEKY